MKVIGYSRLKCKIIYLPSKEGLIMHKRNTDSSFNLPGDWTVKHYWNQDLCSRSATRQLRPCSTYKVKDMLITGLMMSEEGYTFRLAGHLLSWGPAMHCRVCYTKCLPITSLKVPDTAEAGWGWGQGMTERELSYLAAPYSGGCWYLISCPSVLPGWFRRCSL